MFKTTHLTLQHYLKMFHQNEILRKFSRIFMGTPPWKNSLIYFLSFAKFSGKYLYHGIFFNNGAGHAPFEAASVFSKELLWQAGEDKKQDWKIYIPLDNFG